MADVVTGTSATSATQQAAVAAFVQRNLIAQSKLLATVTDFSSLANPGDKSVDIPKMSNFTVTKKSSGTAVDAAALTYSVDTIAFDQHAVVQFLIEKRASLQSRVALAQMNMSRAVEAFAKQVDTDLHADMIANVSASAPDHIIAFAGASFAGVDILEARRLLDVQEWPSDNRFLAVNPAEEKTLLGIDNFIRADAYGSSGGLVNGEIGMLYGAKVIKSTVVTSGRPLYYHKEGEGIAFQQNPEMDSIKDLPNVATRYSLDQLYGVKTLRSGIGIVRLGSAT